MLEKGQRPFHGTIEELSENTAIRKTYLEV
jgi:hypothetical protein